MNNIVTIPRKQEYKKKIQKKKTYDSLHAEQPLQGMELQEKETHKN